MQQCKTVTHITTTYWDDILQIRIKFIKRFMFTICLKIIKLSHKTVARCVQVEARLRITYDSLNICKGEINVLRFKKGEINIWVKSVKVDGIVKKLTKNA